MCQITDRQTSTRELVSDAVLEGEDYPLVEPTDQYDMIMESNYSHTIRTAVIGILIIWALIVLIEGIYNPGSRPVLPH